MENDVPYRLNRDASPAAVLRSVERNGIAVLESFLDPGQLGRMQEEVSNLFDQRSSLDLSFATGEAKRLYRDELSAALSRSPELRRADELPLVRTACDDFFGSGRWETGGLFTMRYRDKMPTNERFHIDPAVSVKFFYYLSDVTTSCGPFTYGLGSHREGYFRMRCSALEGVPGPMIIPDEEVRNITPMEAPAGTLMVFNAIGIHRAGDLQPGSTRFSATFHYVAKVERSLRLRVRRILTRLPQLRATGTAHELAAYEQKHQTRAYRYDN
jgi:Phytanoyl-CoA dioxygenase (PhyH)